MKHRELFLPLRHASSASKSISFPSQNDVEYHSGRKKEAESQEQFWMVVR